MPNSELATISAPQASSRSEVIRRWLVVCGEIYRQELTPELVGTWEMLLHDLDPETVGRGFQAILKTSRFFPTPAEFFAVIQPPAEAIALMEGENAWQLALEYVREFVCPGLPCYGLPLELQMQFAVRAAGGLTFLEFCSTENLIWAKKRFLEAWGAYREVECFDMLPECDVKTFLREFAGTKALPSGPVAAEPMRAEDSKIAAPEASPYRPPSEEQWEHRKREQKEGFKAWLAEHPEAEQPARSEPTVKSRT